MGSPGWLQGTRRFPAVRSSIGIFRCNFPEARSIIGARLRGIPMKTALVILLELFIRALCWMGDFIDAMVTSQCPFCRRDGYFYGECPVCGGLKRI